MTDGYPMPKSYYTYILKELVHPPFRPGYINTMYRRRLREKEGE